MSEETKPFTLMQRCYRGYREVDLNIAINDVCDITASMNGSADPFVDVEVHSIDLKETLARLIQELHAVGILSGEAILRIIHNPLYRLKDETDV